jgi:predicted aspartyl protease
MLLTLPGGESFATGAQTYKSRPAANTDRSNRLFVEIKMEGFRTTAVIDTGTPYMICEPSLAEAAGLTRRSAISSEKLLVRGVLIRGMIHRMNLTITAQEGDEIVLDATVFVPEVDEAAWNLPSFLGWDGCLERLRVAIDPSNDTFYFGAYSD